MSPIFVGDIRRRHMRPTCRRSLS